MSRLIMVSNRVPLPGATGAGGLGTAISAALRSRGGLWFGWSGAISDGVESSPPTTQNFRRQTLVTVDLTREEYNKYYCGFCNGYLWPLFHYRTDLAHYSIEELQTYIHVNRRFAQHLGLIVRDSDIIWIHDYHLLPLGLELRQIGIKNPIGFFLHIPFPMNELTESMPREFEIGRFLGSYDVIGLQTAADAENVRILLSRTAVAPSHNNNTERTYKSPIVKPFPISIPTKLASRAARRSSRSDFAQVIKNKLGAKKLIIGVDRLDYSKGLPERLQAFSLFLEQNLDWHGNVKFAQITPRSRVDVSEYENVGSEVDKLIGSINGRYSDISWSPIIYTNKYFSPIMLSALYRIARVGLVTPLRDGMNLVAKEYVAAQDFLDPGVLILSRFAGAASELPEALIVDPYKPHTVAATIQVALEMPLSERQERHDRMMETLEAKDLKAWYTSFLDQLLSKEQASSTERSDHVPSWNWYERIGFMGVRRGK